MSASHGQYPAPFTATQYARVAAGIVGAIVFAVAGTKMLSIKSGLEDGGGTFTQAMGWFSYGMAVLSILAVIPATLAAAGSLDNDDEEDTGSPTEG